MEERGRYIIVSGWLNHLPSILMGIYAPSDQQANFWADLLKKVDIDTSCVLVVGDFNAVGEIEVDRSKLTKSLTMPMNV